MPNPAKPIFVTLGEVAGVGPEITLRAWQALRGDKKYCFVAHQDPAYLQKLAEKIGLDIPIRSIDSAGIAPDVFSTALPVLPVRLPDSALAGKLNSQLAPAISESIRLGVELCHNGVARAIVTNPIHKSSMANGGFQYPGHTEFLSHLCGGKKPVMMLANSELRVVPLTVHQPISAVAGKITPQTIVEICDIVNQNLKKYFGIANPRLAIAGLNPHAGEDGQIGNEEIKIYTPAIAAMRNMGMNVTPPLSADTMFFAQARQSYDAAICAYHDQALIPVKTIDFWNTVNITLGLDIIRTSPDHGTAIDIAGKGIARADSLIAAIRTSAEMADRHG